MVKALNKLKELRFASRIARIACNSLHACVICGGVFHTRGPALLLELVFDCALVFCLNRGHSSKSVVL